MSSNAEQMQRSLALVPAVDNRIITCLGSNGVSAGVYDCEPVESIRTAANRDPSARECWIINGDEQFCRPSYRNQGVTSECRHERMKVKSLGRMFQCIGVSVGYDI